jgi:hypothetical protein
MKAAASQQFPSYSYTYSYTPISPSPEIQLLYLSSPLDRAGRLVVSGGDVRPIARNARILLADALQDGGRGIKKGENSTCDRQENLP